MNCPEKHLGILGSVILVPFLLSLAAMSNTLLTLALVPNFPCEQKNGSLPFTVYVKPRLFAVLNGYSVNVVNFSYNISFYPSV